jgi:hypothetical protein
MKQRLENITSAYAAETFERDEPDMHVTPTVDYAVVLEGCRLQSNHRVAHFPARFLQLNRF